MDISSRSYLDSKETTSLILPCAPVSSAIRISPISNSSLLSTVKNFADEFHSNTVPSLSPALTSSSLLNAFGLRVASK